MEIYEATSTRQRWNRFYCIITPIAEFAAKLSSSFRRGQEATARSITTCKRIEEDDVEEEHPQTVSLMPEGLVANFTEQQLSDLVEYLLTLRQGDAVQR